MKLTRSTTTDCGTEGKRNQYFGNTHLFYIENARPCELIAIEELLCEAGWSCDDCPNYEEGDAFGHAGYTSGFWIDVDDVANFKADYKRLKGQLAPRIARNEAKKQGDALDAMEVEAVEAVAKIAGTIARELRKKSETLSGVRGIKTTANIILNPYHNLCGELTAEGWEVIHAVLMTGNMEDVISWLYTLELNCEASVVRRPLIAKLMQCEELTYEEAHRAIRQANNLFNDAVNLVREAKAKERARQEEKKADADRLEAERTNNAIDTEIGMLRSDIRGCRREFDGAKLDEVIWQRIRSTAARIAQVYHVSLSRDFYKMQIQQSMILSCYHLEAAHAEALEINREMPRFNEAAGLLSERIDNGNSEPLNEAETLQVVFWTKMNSAQRQQAVEDAHAEALESDAARRIMKGCKAMGDYLANENELAARAALSVSGLVYKSAGATLLLTPQCVYLDWGDNRCKLVRELSPQQIIADTVVFSTTGDTEEREMLPGHVEDSDFPLDAPGEWMLNIFKRPEEPEVDPIPQAMRHMESLMHDLYRDFNVPDLRVEAGKLIGFWMDNGEEKHITLYEGEDIGAAHDMAAQMNAEEIKCWDDQQRAEIAAEARNERYFEEGNGAHAFYYEDMARWGR